MHISTLLGNLLAGAAAAAAMAITSTPTPAPTATASHTFAFGVGQNKSNNDCYLMALSGKASTTTVVGTVTTGSPTTYVTGTSFEAGRFSYCSWDSDVSTISAAGQTVTVNHESDGTHLDWDAGECVFNHDIVNVFCTNV